MGRPIKDLRIVKLAPDNQLTPLYPTHEYKKGSTTWVCQCSCGKIYRVRSNDLVQNKTRSCGCLRKETMKKQRKTERNQKLISLYKGGTSVNQLIKIFKISKQRIYQIIKQYT